MTRARGGDFSSYQDEAATRKAIAHGLDFGIVKATQGLGYVNPLLHLQLKLLREHGAIAGVYHFLEPGENGARQWDFFEQTSSAGVVRLVAVDHEANEHGVTPADDVVRAFIRRGRQRGYRVGRYGSSGVMRRSLGEDWRWLAWWNPGPPPLKWDVWQFSSAGGQDWNVFRGDVAALHRWAAANSQITRPALRWWIHDDAAQRALGPFRLARAGGALVAYALRHPRSGAYTVTRQ